MSNIGGINFFHFMDYTPSLYGLNQEKNALSQLSARRSVRTLNSSSPSASSHKTNRESSPPSRTDMSKNTKNFIDAMPISLRKMLASSLLDHNQPVYFEEGFDIFQKANNLSLQTLKNKIINNLLIVFETSPWRLIPIKTQKFLLDKMLAALPDFAAPIDPNILYGSKEWAKRRIGIEYARSNKQEVSSLDSARLQSLGDQALESDAADPATGLSWGQKMLLLIARARGDLGQGRIQDISAADLTRTLKKVHKTVFADDIAKTDAISDFLRHHRHLVDEQNNTPTLPSPYTMEDRRAYETRFVSYKDEVSLETEQLIEAQVRMLPKAIQNEIKAGRSRVVTPQLRLAYEKIVSPGTVSDGLPLQILSNKYRVTPPGALPLLLKVKEGDKDKYILFSITTIEPKIKPEGIELKEWIMQNQSSFFPQAWLTQKTDEFVANEVRSNAFNPREMPEHSDVRTSYFFDNVSESQNKPFLDITIGIKQKLRALIQETFIPTEYDRRSNEFVSVFRPLAEFLVPGAAALAHFASGDIKGALTNLALDGLALFGVGAVGKVVQALERGLVDTANFVKNLIKETVDNLTVRDVAFFTIFSERDLAIFPVKDLPIEVSTSRAEPTLHEGKYYIAIENEHGEKYIFQVKPEGTGAQTKWRIWDPSIPTNSVSQKLGPFIKFYGQNWVKDQELGLLGGMKRRHDSLEDWWELTEAGPSNQPPPSPPPVRLSIGPVHIGTTSRPPVPGTLNNALATIDLRGKIFTDRNAIMSAFLTRRDLSSPNSVWGQIENSFVRTGHQRITDYAIPPRTNYKVLIPQDAPPANINSIVPGQESTNLEYMKYYNKFITDASRSIQSRNDVLQLIGWDNNYTALYNPTSFVVYLVTSPSHLASLLRENSFVGSLYSHGPVAADFEYWHIEPR